VCNGCVAPQVAEGHGVSLGPHALRAHQHPDVGDGVALDARRLPPLHPPCAPAGFRGAAGGGGAPLRDVSSPLAGAAANQTLN